MKLTGRKREIAILQSAIASEKPELVAVVGRRRVGKTFLVRSVYAGDVVFGITGLQKGGKKEQLQNFVLAMKYAGLTEELERPENWLDAFFELTRLIDRQQYGKKVVVFFDELPWLDTRRSGFLQGFSFFWNSWASQRNVVVVICGSAASWMIKKVINDRGGLHNRVTRIMHLKPFSLRETELFLRAKGIQYPHYQLLQLYMALGGIPMYLEMIQPELSPIENINLWPYRK
ncbi:MAG: ATP-binding protein [Lewinellaceae bacterium]|nr:ATP-binding protein [Phaeodactylibacter sp.]MCB9038085.1 ATP-binding protein [Lewinellaceae bacterium]